MKNQNMQDERVLQQRRKITSEACSILMLVLLASILIQQYVLQAPIEQYAVEAICFFGISFYIVGRYMVLGLRLNNKRNKYFIFLNSFITGLTVTLINGFLNYQKYQEQYLKDGIGYFIATLVITFFSAAVATFIVLSLLQYFERKRQDKIEKQLDEEEQRD